MVVNFGFLKKVRRILPIQKFRNTQVTRSSEYLRKVLLVVQLFLVARKWCRYFTWSTHNILTFCSKYSRKSTLTLYFTSCMIDNMKGYDPDLCFPGSPFLWYFTLTVSIFKRPLDGCLFSMMIFRKFFFSTDKVSRFNNFRFPIQHTCPNLEIIITSSYNGNAHLYSSIVLFHTYGLVSTSRRREFSICFCFFLTYTRRHPQGHKSFGGATLILFYVIVTSDSFLYRMNPS